MLRCAMSFLSAGLVISWSWLALIPADSNPPATEDEFTAAQIEFFESQVRPILVEHCYDCHGPDSDPVEGGLSMVSRKSILAGGDSGPAIDLENLSESYLLSAVEYGDLFQMPPDSRLDEESVEIIRKWVMDKAPWPADSDIEAARKEDFDIEKRKAAHWCWQPVSSPGIPDVSNKDWPLDPLDHFILEKLEAANLVPAASADRRTWLRRVTFDLTGLPPTREETDAFLQDASPQAFETVVDRLLASPRFGERWARHWMDLIRYAETCGHEFDYPIPNAWRYRDYLIRAFNQDVPYNDFVMEHVAGDLIESPRRHPVTGTNESILGTGFWFLGEATHGPVDVKGDEAGRIDNQIDVMGKTFLGLTIACARCHDHKFDAISDEDYYGLAGFLQSSRRQDVMLDPDQKIQQGFQEARAESERVSELVSEHIRSLEDSQLLAMPYEKYLRGAVACLQLDNRWLLPDRMIVEGESLKEVSKTKGNVRPQKLAEWSNSNQIWWTDAGVEDELTLSTNAPVAGEYEWLIRFTKAPDYGTVQVYVNDQPAGEPIDLYATKVERSEEISLGTFDLDAGPQNIRFRITGKNEQAVAGYMVGIDYIVLHTRRDAVNDDHLAGQFAKIASDLDIDPVLLGNWVAGIKDPATGDLGHPFYLIRKAAESGIDLNSDAGDKFFRDLYRQLNDLEKANVEWLEEKSIPLPALTTHPLQEWDRQGFAFSDQYQPGQVNFADPHSIWTWKNEIPHSGMYGKRFQGVLRSPTFEVTHPGIYYHGVASDARIRLIIDGFRLDVNNALLFNGMTLTANTNGKWQWIHQTGDMKNHVGHRAFIEIIDQGDGFIGVDQIRLAHSPPPANRPSSISINPQHHALDQGSWHDWRFNKGATPLELVTQGIANAIREGKWLSAGESEVQDRALFDFLSKHRLVEGVDYTGLADGLRDSRNRIEAINKATPAPVLAIGMVDGSPENEYVFVRGNHNNLGEQVPRAPIAALNDAGKWNYELTTSGRFELAENMISPDHPLTRRVIVNRVWHHLTGRGIVRSVDNFGVLGDKPTHPELLDYLANEFSSDGWSIKKLIRRIVLSQTYRMDSVNEIDASTIDPDNQLLYKFRIRRLQGEAIRDAILAISGSLDDTMYGPGVPIHLTSFMQGRGRPGRSGPLDGQGRRSIYIEVRRNFLSPMMLAFDTPIPFNSIGRRNLSNVPAQALIMLNDPFVADQTGKWADHMMQRESVMEKRVRIAFEQATGRLPKDTEARELAAFVEDQVQNHQLSERDAFAELCHVLVNTKEFIYIR